jgi:ferrochelatase
VKTGVLVINFGEPEGAEQEDVVAFLERIFLSNASLEGRQPDEVRRARSHELAVARAPALLEEYREIGGSPLNAQARAQAEGLERVLRGRGHDATCYPAFQFLRPSVEDGVRAALADGVDRLVALPVYPLCGQSTTVAALDEVERVSTELGRIEEVLTVSGWHLHPDFIPLHADHIAGYCRTRGIDLLDEGTRILFSIHGTPIRYLEAGSRYDRYVDEVCSGIARRLGVTHYAMGYQNHTNRPIDWTEPDVEEVVDGVEARRLIVVAPSFMHEQSETLGELDRHLRRRAESRGLSFHRVPIPHDSPRFLGVLADLVEGRLGSTPAGHVVDWRRCLCRPGGQTRCTNGMRLRTMAVPTAGDVSG